MLVILLRLRDDPNSYPFLCGVYLEVQHRRAGSIRTPRPAFYDQENCNLSLYKSSRISLTNAILYCQSPVYLQQLKSSRRRRKSHKGRILNPSLLLKRQSTVSICTFTNAFLSLLRLIAFLLKIKQAQICILCILLTLKIK